MKLDRIRTPLGMGLITFSCLGLLAGLGISTYLMFTSFQTDDLSKKTDNAFAGILVTFCTLALSGSLFITGQSIVLGEDNSKQLSKGEIQERIASLKELTK